MKKKSKPKTMKKEYPHITRGRTKKDRITVENFMFESRILLKISASLEDWRTLRASIPLYGTQSYKDYLARLGKLFWLHFIIPCDGEITTKRASQRERMNVLKMFAGFLHTFFKECFARPDVNIPCVSRMLRDDHFPEYMSINDPVGWTAYCMQLLLGENLRHSTLLPLANIGDVETAQDLQSFYITYVQDGQKLIRKTKPEKIVDFWNDAFINVTLGFGTAPVTRSVEDVFAFYWTLAHAFLYRPGASYFRPQLECYQDILAIREILLQTYPFLRHIDETLEKYQKGIHHQFDQFPFVGCSLENCGTKSCRHKDAERTTYISRRKAPNSQR